MSHEATISALAMGLCKIGDKLPRVQLAVVMYPTARMKQAVAELYAHIIKFFIRTQSWHQENWVKHAWHSISRPVELRYSDLLSEIEMRSQMVHELTIAGSQAKQRVMYRKMDEVAQRSLARDSGMVQIKDLLSSKQFSKQYRGRNSLPVSLHIVLSGEFVQTNQLISNVFLKTTEYLSIGFSETNQRLEDLQLCEIIDFVAIATVTDPDTILTLCLALMARRRNKQAQATHQYTWLHPGWPIGRDPIGPP